MWIVEKYVKYLIGFALVWFGLWFYRSCGCAKVQGSAMNPTYVSDEFLRIDKGKTKPNQIQSKDLVWFKYQAEGSKEDGYLARVIGMPGDRIAMKNGEVQVNGGPLAESEYIKPEFIKKNENIPELIVPRGCYFLLVDNRKAAMPPDSRRFGPISVNAIYGKVKR